MENIFNQVSNATIEICEKANLKAGDILVVGCSSSEISGGVIGKNSSADIGKTVFEAINNVISEKGIYLAAQCCEHLNRAIVIEKSALKYDSEIVNVIPKPKAGGSFATAAYEGFKEPVCVEFVKADAGLDIGLTLIGMHLKKVAVPVRLQNNKVGEAIVVAARTRAKFIGGERANYNEDLY